MKKPSNVRLSLRKLLVATLAVGPLAVLPAPLWAAVPSSAPYTVTSGAATWSVTPGVTGTVIANDKTILVWGAGNFSIAPGETFNFQLPTNGAILNKVGYTTTGGLAAADNVTINGALLSSGRVFVLANGNINVGDTAVITTGGGLYLSTLQEASDFNFLTTGNLSGAAATTSLGNVTIGTNIVTTGLTANTTYSATPLTVNGNLDVAAGAIVSNRAVVSGDLVYRAITANSGINLAATAVSTAVTYVAPVVGVTADPTATPPVVGVTAVPATYSVSAVTDANLVVRGNLTVTTNNGTITQTSAVKAGVAGSSSSLGSQTATFSTGASGAGVAVTLSNTANDFQTVLVNGAGTAADTTITDVNIVGLGASTIGRDLFVTAPGTADKTAVSNSGTLTIGRDASFTTTTGNSGVSIGNNSTIAGNLAAALTSNSSFTFNALGNVTIGTVGAVTGISVGTGNKTGVTVTAGNGTLTVNSAVTSAGNGTSGANITLNGGVVTTAAAISQTAATGSTVTLNATTGNVTVSAAITGDKLSLKTAGGAITQTAGILTTANAGNQTSPVANSFNAGTGVITLNGANALAAGSVVQLTGASAAITNTNTMWLGTSNVTGNATLTTTGATAGVQLGAGLGTSGQALVIGGVLKVVTGGGSITDENSGAQTITGGLDFATLGGAVTLDAATVNGSFAPNIQFGGVAINSGAGGISIAETSPLNLGNITTTGGLTATSVTGGITDSGTIATASSTFKIKNTTESVVLDNTAHTLTALTVDGGTNHSIVVGGATTLSGSTYVGTLNLSSTTGTALSVGANNITGDLNVNSGGTVAVTGPLNVGGNLSLTAADISATSITQSNTGAGILVTGTTTLASSGNITLDKIGNNYGTVVLNGVAGDAKIADANGITISGNATALVEVTAGLGNATSGVGGAHAVVLGNLIVGSLTATAADGTGGTGGGGSGTITQAAGTKIHSNGSATFKTDAANIVIDNTGNNFGRVNANTTSKGAITLRELDTLRVGAISTEGATKITSDFGSIIEDNSTGATATNYSVNGTLTLSSPSGSIQLGNQTILPGGAATTGTSTAITASAPNGSVQLFSSKDNLSLGAISANSFYLTASGNVSQSAAINSYGPATFNATAQNLTLTNSGNNFGRVSITMGGTGKHASITENATLNLGSVTMATGATGNFTATSTTGDIIDTGLGGIKLGGTVASPGTGIVTLIATKGNIELNDPTTEFATTGGVVFNGGNVTLAGLGQSTIWLGASTTASTAGNLTVTSATGSIGNAGNLTVTGNASFQAAAGNISLGQSANAFGSLKFMGNQISIAQVGNMNIQTGSIAIGQAQLAASTGNIAISDVGGGTINFGNTVGLSAAGTITLPKLVQAVGVITVNAAGTKDLSALSKSSDLAGKDPVNLGTGAYVPPNP